VCESVCLPAIPGPMLQPMMLSPCPARQHLVLRAVSLLSAHHAAVFSLFLSSHRSCFLSLFAPIEQLTPQLCFLSPNLWGSWSPISLSPFPHADADGAPLQF
jgi:hypothetical protein